MIHGNIGHFASRKCTLEFLIAMLTKHKLESRLPFRWYRLEMPAKHWPFLPASRSLFQAPKASQRLNQ